MGFLNMLCRKYKIALKTDVSLEKKIERKKACDKYSVWFIRVKLSESKIEGVA